MEPATIAAANVRRQFKSRPIEIFVEDGNAVKPARLLMSGGGMMTDIVERCFPNHPGRDPWHDHSPDLFIWQSSQEAEEQEIDPDKKPLKKEPEKETQEIRRIRLDTLVGMAMSNVIGIAIVITTSGGSQTDSRSIC
jgi:hypothetical protein